MCTLPTGSVDSPGPDQSEYSACLSYATWVALVTVCEARGRQQAISGSAARFRFRGAGLTRLHPDDSNGGMLLVRYSQVCFARGTRHATLGIAAVLAGCGGGAGPVAPPTPPAAPQHTVGGTVAGLTGTGLQLLNNGDNATPVSAAGVFVFSRTAIAGAPYAVTVSAQPTSPAQLCSVANGSGTIASSNVTNVIVSCADVPSTSARLKFYSESAFETYLVYDSPDDLRRFRFELYVDHVRTVCCDAWNTAVNAPNAAVKVAKYVQHVGANLTPYTNGRHLYEVRVIDPVTLTILARDSIVANADVENKLLNGDAFQSASGPWTIEFGSIATRQYSNSGSALFNMPVSPYEKNAIGVRESGYFTTEGAVDRRVVMHQRVTLAFPGFTDGTTGLYWGGAFGVSAGGTSSMQIDLVGQNPDGSLLRITGSEIRATGATRWLNPDFRYGQLPKGIQYADVTVTIDAQGGGEAFADNMFVSIVRWPY